MARRNHYNYGKFTPARRAALKKAAYISARKRAAKKKTIKRATITVGVLAGGLAIGYAGHKHGGTISKHVGDQVRGFKPAIAHARNQIGMRIAVDPHVKEETRIASAISENVTSPNTGHGQFSTAVLSAARADAKARAEADRKRTENNVTQVFEGHHAQAQELRDKLEQEKLPPHLGGPDRRKYDEDDSVDSEKMTNNSVRKTLAAERRKTRGRRSGSLKGTPGGRQTTPKAQKPKGAGPSGMTEAQIEAALGFDEAPKSYPKGLKGPTVAGTTVGPNPAAAVAGKHVPDTLEGALAKRKKNEPLFLHDDDPY